MALVGLLRTEGPLTATRAAELTGESVASCSYHLRMLAKYGIVEEVPGPGRQKPWRATTQFTDVPRGLEPAAAAAATDLRVYLAGQYFEHLARALRTTDRLSPEWQDAEQFGDLLLYLTPDELTGLYDAFDKLVQPFYTRNVAPETRPEGAELVHLLRIAFRKDHAAEGLTAPDSPSPSPSPTHPTEPQHGSAS
ncbi:helix-turn-helix domain-containing protein [Catenulispora yoronensis]